MSLNESVKNEVLRCLNESEVVTAEPQRNKRPSDATEWTFADWFGEDLTGKTYDGNLYCHNIGFDSLKGAPEKVNGDFSCLHNHLTSLEGAPEKVEGDFSCSENQLTSLEGAPKEVNGNFHCVDNQLTSLEGAPKKIGGSFSCSCNKLTSLKGAPEKVEGDFSCSRNQLTSLEGAPKEVGGDFNCDYNKLTSLEGAPDKINGDLDCRDNINIKIGQGFKFPEALGKIIVDLSVKKSIPPEMRNKIKGVQSESEKRTSKKINGNTLSKCLSHVDGIINSFKNVGFSEDDDVIKAARNFSSILEKYRSKQ